jgi:hypothetical protein
MAAKRKNKKAGLLFVMLCLVFIAVYGGLKGGQYLATRMEKPVPPDKNALEGAQGGARAGDDVALSENDLVKLAAVATEFLNAEHNKKSSSLVNLVDADYYNKLVSNNKKLSTGSITIKDINYMNIERDMVKIETTYFKFSTKYAETVTLKLKGGTWKVTESVRKQMSS